LGPILEQAVRAAGGAVKLVKVDIDQNQQIAQQLRIQSIPAVYAFHAGRPVDGFSGAQTESQVKAFIDKLVASTGGETQQSPIAEALERAAALLEAGDTVTAGQLFDQILGHEPDNVAALTGMARCRLADNDAARARELLDAVPDDKRNDPEVAAALSALELAEKASDAGDVGALRAAVAENGDDHQARFDLALALYAAGEREGAVDELIELLRRNREWNEQAARKQLLQLFEAQGPTDALTVTGRRRMSALLFS
jgi:putative thioredoxin